MEKNNINERFFLVSVVSNNDFLGRVATVEMLGVDTSNPDVNLFWRENADSVKFYTIPKVLQNKVMTHVNRANRALSDMSVSHGRRKILTESMLIKYMDLFEVYKKDFYKEVHDILSGYSLLMDIFIPRYQKVMERTRKMSRSEILNEMPKRENFTKFSMGIDIIEVLPTDDIIRDFVTKALEVAKSILAPITSSFKEEMNKKVRLTKSLVEKISKINQLNLEKNPDIKNLEVLITSLVKNDYFASEVMFNLSLEEVKKRMMEISDYYRIDFKL